MTRRTRRLAGWTAFLAVFLGAAVLIWLGSPPPPPAVPLPDPNGYDDLLHATTLVGRSSPTDTNAAPELLAAWVTANQPALDRVRLGLSRPCRVPPIAQPEIEAHLEKIGRFKTLGRLLAAEAEVARHDRQWDRVVQASTNGVAFALAVSRGGVMIDDLVSLALERIARTPLAQAVPDLPAASARQTALALAALDATRDSFAQVLAHEEAFARRSSRGAMRLAWEVFLRRRLRADFDKMQPKRNAVILDTRRLALELAARAYALERGQPAAAARELVPDYLPAVPTDPATGQPLELTASRESP